MNKNVIEIKIPEEIRDNIQRADMEYQSRRNILIYIMENDIKIPQERIDKYQKECDEKFIIFENLKTNLEQQYVKPNTNNLTINHWQLDYKTCILTIEQ